MNSSIFCENQQVELDYSKILLSDSYRNTTNKE